jgi:hypothetical protein
MRESGGHGGDRGEDEKHCCTRFIEVSFVFLGFVGILDDSDRECVLRTDEKPMNKSVIFCDTDCGQDFVSDVLGCQKTSLSILHLCELSILPKTFRRLKWKTDTRF